MPMMFYVANTPTRVRHLPGTLPDHRRQCEVARCCIDHKEQGEIADSDDVGVVRRSGNDI